MLQQKIMAQRGAQAQQQPQPQAGGQDLNFGMDTTQNPYASFMQQSQQQPQQPDQENGQEDSAQGEEQPEDQLNPGQNPGSTKFLMGAINSLENYIKQSTDRDEIATSRSIIMLLGRLIQKDQQNMTNKLS